MNQTPFFNDQAVRQQLNLNDNQFSTLNRAYQDAYGRYNQSLNGLNSSLTEQQRQAQLQQYATQFGNDFNRTLDSTFTDPTQRTRFNQLRMQSLGANAFNDPAIQRQLNLTPQQQTQLRQMAAQWQTQMGQFGDGTNIDPNQWSQVSSQYWDQLNSVLTPQQQQTWQQLVGQRFNFSPNAFFETGAIPPGGRGLAPGPPPNGRVPQPIGNVGPANGSASTTGNANTPNTTGNQSSRQNSPNTANRSGSSTR